MRFEGGGRTTSTVFASCAMRRSLHKNHRMPKPAALRSEAPDRIEMRRAPHRNPRGERRRRHDREDYARIRDGISVVTPNRTLRIVCETRTAPASPSTPPIAISRAPCVMTSRRISLGKAPSAMRTPISCVGQLCKR